MRKAILFVAAVIFLLCMTIPAVADHAPSSQTELVEAGELTFAIPQGYDSGRPFEYSKSVTGTKIGSCRYTYWIEERVMLAVTLNVRSVDSFEDETGLNPRVDSQDYLMQAAELMMAGSPVNMYEWEYVETDTFDLLRVWGVVKKTGSSFDMFVLRLTNRLYHGTVSVSKPGYVDACSAYMDVVLSEVLPKQESVSFDGNITLNIPTGYDTTDNETEDDREIYTYEYEIDTHYRGYFHVLKMPLSEFEEMAEISREDDAAAMADGVMRLLYESYPVEYEQCLRLQLDDADVIRVSGISASYYFPSGDCALIYAGDWAYVVGFFVSEEGYQDLCKSQMDQALLPLQ